MSRREINIVEAVLSRASSSGKNKVHRCAQVTKYCHTYELSVPMFAFKLKIEVAQHKDK